MAIDLKRKKIYVWGAKERGIRIIRILSEHDIRVSCIIDNNPAFKDCCLENIPVIKITDVKEEPDVIILGTSNKRIQEDMIETLKKMKIGVEVLTFSDFHNQYECLWDIDSKKGYNVHFESLFTRWLDNILSEVDFWKNQVADIDGRWHSTYKEKYIPKEFSCDRISDEAIGSDSVILDVGCGLLSQYGTLKEGKKLNVMGIDPLAYFYNTINSRYFEKYNIKYTMPNIRFGILEILSLFIPAGTADIILVDNALDHCFDPYIAIIECLKVLKLGGAFSTNHRIDEACNECYSGLHQWNITCVDDELIIWNNESYVNISERLDKWIDFEIHRTESNMNSSFGTIVCNMRKKCELPNVLSEGISNYSGVIINGLMDKLADLKFAQKMMDIMKDEGRY